MDSRYLSHQHETEIANLWEKHQVFNPDSPTQPAQRKNKAGETTPHFSILLPPPNANDPLHIGHAMYVVEDVLIRYHRMMGDDTLWLPGTDHAGIETQFVYEKKLKKQGKSRFDFDRQTLYQDIWQYVQENSDIAINQLKKLGFSLDWSRFTFMLDEAVVKIVLDTFGELAEQDLIYRDLRLVNYCTRCGTSFSELEVVYQDQTAPLYYVRYHLVNNPSEYIVVATTRPEPIFADTHLAVHPENPKTKQFVGAQVLNPLTNEPMTIIADEFVNPEFGTGIVKLTPAHDHTDFSVAQKHHLPIITAVNTMGKLTENAGQFAGMRIKAAREAVVAYLQEQNLIEKIDQQYQNRIGTCYRCSTIIEPLPLPQFFVKVKSLTQRVLAALDTNEVTISGAGHDKILRHWLEHLQDWNISRQIVWGIRLPVWYDTTKHPDIRVIFMNSNQERVSGTLSELLAEYGGSYSLTDIVRGLQEMRAPVGAAYVISQTSPGNTFLQDTDTFDTWFSSAQWPFTTLMSNQPGDFQRFYPTSVMETGYDILPFWVIRMLMMGLFKTDQVPFKHIYLHGLIRDQAGKKMSKSKGNTINPLKVVDEYGADALRLALVIRSSAGLDKSVGPADFKAARNLTNKLWNATRFIVMQLENEDKNIDKSIKKQNEQFSQRLQELVVSITQQLTDYKIGLAAETLYNEFWHWYCDECIELAKSGQLSPTLLLQGLITFLKLLHPFIPFVTETIWQELQQLGLLKTDDQLTHPESNHQLLTTSAWPA